MAKIIFRNPINKKEYPITGTTFKIAAFGFGCAAAGAVVKGLLDDPYMIPDSHLASIYNIWYDRMPGGTLYNFYTANVVEGCPLKKPAFYAISEEDDGAFDKILKEGHFKSE